MSSTFVKRRAAYELFIASPTWAAIKTRYRGSDLPQTCIVCGTGEGLHLHHTTYERFGGSELLADLMPLCGEHHMAWHRRDGKCLTPAEQKLVRDHLAVLGEMREAAGDVVGRKKSRQSKRQQRQQTRQHKRQRKANTRREDPQTFVGRKGGLKLGMHRTRVGMASEELPCETCRKPTRLRTRDGVFCSSVCGAWMLTHRGGR